MIKLTGIFKIIEEHTFTPDKCFLCGCLLTDETKTEEHVIPKWLQNRFNLWDQKIFLLNGTLLPYRQITIPCCFNCNNIHLKPFEDKVHEAFKIGYEAFRELDKNILFLWLGKIYFGIIYRELFLRIDRSNPEKGTITSTGYLKSFYSHFLFLQGIRKKHSFQNFFPASIFLFKTQKPKRIEEQWDFIDNQQSLFISIRMGEIGIIAILQDCGATKQLEGLLDHHRDIELHPLQFREITAKILYKSFLINRTPKFTNIQTDDRIETYSMPLQGFNNTPVFEDWDNDIYSMLLSKYLELPLEICQPEKGKVFTWLMDKNGESIFIPVDK
ncbi:hypothetical protein [Fibrella aquatica]|uniref:hypothetical protein n=1 Tax=Fibrella aquatica TaxID=3242487 RepID=UPI00351FF0BA